MQGFWAEIWRSPRRAILAGVLLSITISSILYGFNWHTFYDTSANIAETRAELVAKDVTTLALATDAAPGNDKKFREALAHYLDGRKQLITVTRVNNADNTTIWVQDNGATVDTSRTLLNTDIELPVGGGIDNDQPLHLNFSVGIRPHYVVSLARAWTFSILDYLEDPKVWWDKALYNRSVPLYGYLLTVILVGFGTIRTFYRDQQELMRLEREANDIARELDQMRNEHSEEIDAFNKHIDHAQHQRDDALRNREELIRQIEGIEREYQKIIDTSTTSTDEELLKETAERRSQVERVLESYNVKVRYYEQELNETRSELNAAEQLLHEVEGRREGLNAKLKERNKEIQKLHSLIHDTQKEIRNAQASQLRQDKAHIRELREWEESQDTIEEQLGCWIKSGEPANVNFSEHALSVTVEQQFQKIDQAFVDRYFTHVHNSEYKRGSRRVIRVVTDNPQDSSPSAKLIVVLDDDAGRTMTMRYETRKDAPDSAHLGFVLALLLRTKCKDFKNFSIRTR